MTGVKQISVKLDLPKPATGAGRQGDIYCDTPVAQHGQCQVQTDGTVTYVPNVGFIGTDTVTYAFADLDGQTKTGLREVTIDAAACFTPGTRIATPKGERRIETLQVGDKVITRDNGIQDVRWIGSKPLDWTRQTGNTHLKPILIKAGALGNGLPERDMAVSPDHRLLVSNSRTALYFEEQEIFVPAKLLVDNIGVFRSNPETTSYWHFMFDAHQVVLANGAWTESFQPSDYALKAVGNAQRLEILELFPALRTQKGMSDYGAARKTLPGTLSGVR